MYVVIVSCLLIRSLMKQVSHTHKSDDTVVLEGKRMILDAFKAGLYPSIVVFSRLRLLADIPFDKDKDLAMYQIPYRNINMWSELSTPPGLMGNFNMDIKLQFFSRD